jgi:TRAP-type uncharacterized transport system fused permease subunit
MSGHDLIKEEIAAVAVTTDSNGKIKLDQAQLDELEVKYSNIRSLTKWGLLIVSLIAIVSSLYHLYASLYMPNYQLHLSMHLLFMMTPIFFMYPILSKTLSGKMGMDKIPIYDLFLAGLSALVCLYWVYFYPEIVMRSGAETDLDLIIGGLGILLVLEATRRTVGIALSIIASLFIAYAYFGAYMPGILGNRGYSIERIITSGTRTGHLGVPCVVSHVRHRVHPLRRSSNVQERAVFISFGYALTGWKGGPQGPRLASGFFARSRRLAACGHRRFIHYTADESRIRRFANAVKRHRPPAARSCL